jgi:hypothetical protein
LQYSAPVLARWREAWGPRGAWGWGAGEGLELHRRQVAHGSTVAARSWSSGSKSSKHRARTKTAKQQQKAINRWQKKRERETEDDANCDTKDKDPQRVLLSAVIFCHLLSWKFCKSSILQCATMCLSRMLKTWGKTLKIWGAKSG